MILVHSNKIASLFNEAEVALKQYERINLLNLLPAVNELRYAGRHLLEAENAISEEDREKHEAQAIDHCERAKWPRRWIWATTRFPAEWSIKINTPLFKPKPNAFLRDIMTDMLVGARSSA